MSWSGTRKHRNADSHLFRISSSASSAFFVSLLRNPNPNLGSFASFRGHLNLFRISVSAGSASFAFPSRNRNRNPNLVFFALLSSFRGYLDLVRISDFGFRISAAAVLLASSLVTRAQLIVLPEKEPQHLFGAGARTIPVLLRNDSVQPAGVAIRTRLYQASSATAVVLSEAPWKKPEVLPGQTVVESATVDFPAVKAETRFLIKWLAGTNEVLGMTEVLVYPTNLLRELRTLAGEEPLGVFDPQNALKPLLKSAGVEFSDLEDAGTEAYQGKLVLAGPFQNQSEMRSGLAAQLRALARKGAGVVWIQPPPQKDARHRERLKPSFYTVPEGKGAVVMVQPALVQNLPHDPQAQLNLVHFARLALHPEPLSLPYLTPEQ
jgi:hypothetical protein